MGGKIKSNHTAFDYEIWKLFAEFAQLVVVTTPLAAFRRHKESKTGDVKGAEQYLEDSGLSLPKFSLLPIRFIRELLFFVGRWLKLTPHISFSESRNKWEYYSGQRKIKEF